MRVQRHGLAGNANHEKEPVCAGAMANAPACQSSTSRYAVLGALLLLITMLLAGCIAQHTEPTQSPLYPAVGTEAVYSSSRGSLVIARLPDGFDAEGRPAARFAAAVQLPDRMNQWIFVDKETWLPTHILTAGDIGWRVTRFDGTRSTFLQEHLWGPTPGLWAPAFLDASLDDSLRLREGPAPEIKVNGFTREVTFFFPQAMDPVEGYSWRKTNITLGPDGWAAGFGTLLGLGLGVEDLRLDAVRAATLGEPPSFPPVMANAQAKPRPPDFADDDGLAYSMANALRHASLHTQYQAFMAQHPGAILSSALYEPLGLGSQTIGEWTLVWTATLEDKSFPDTQALALHIRGRDLDEGKSVPIGPATEAAPFNVAMQYPTRLVGNRGQLDLGPIIRSLNDHAGEPVTFLYQVMPDLERWDSGYAEHIVAYLEDDCVHSVRISAVTGALLEEFCIEDLPFH